jgi:hypothetical protein
VKKLGTLRQTKQGPTLTRSSNTDFRAENLVGHEFIVARGLRPWLGVAVTLDRTNGFSFFCIFLFLNLVTENKEPMGF